jgi:hypothetical protein
MLLDNFYNGPQKVVEAAIQPHFGSVLTSRETIRCVAQVARYRDALERCTVSRCDRSGRAARPDRPSSASVLLGQHDRQHARCLRGIRRIA